ncbi:MAG: methylmalonyl-CoA mutase family protein, partial [Chloroflexota bacterium]
GARDPRSLPLRFHTQTGGSTLTAQQPLNNVVRVTLQALSAVLGGTQSLHTNGFDEALALPSEQAATLALRTQQIIAKESGVPDVTDPLGGSYLIEYLTDQLAEQARSLIAEIDELGGSVAAIQSGSMQEQIEEAAYRFQRDVDDGERVIVGVNEYRQPETEIIELLEPNPALEQEQIARLHEIRRTRDADRVSKSLACLEAAARGTDNVMYPLRAALSAYATIGDVSDVLRRAFGTHDPAVAV